nr:MAG TPA: protein of unknown function DUF285 [Caudoviricetes sp.]
MSDICYNGAEEPQTAKGIVKINYKEDFEVVVELMAGDEPYKIGEVDDFEIKFQVGVATYSVGRKAGVWNRCELADENKVRCFLSKHKLHVGRLRVEVYVKTQDANFENGKRLHVAIAEGVVELVRENSRFDAAEIKAYVPMVLTDAYKLAKEHGYGGTQEEYYNTFSDITSLLGELRSVAENESQRVEAEKKREEYTDKIHATLGEAERLAALRKKEYEQEMEVRKVVEAEPKDPQYNIWFDMKTGTVKRTPVEDPLSCTTYRVYYMGAYTVKGWYGALARGYGGPEKNEYVKELDLSRWDTTLMTSAVEMFSGWENLKFVDLDGWTMENVENTRNMFSGCNSLQTLDTSSWDLSNLIKAGAMFSDCNSLQTLDTSSWNLSNLIEAVVMFDNCNSLQTLDTSSWNLSNLIETSYMFSGCSSLKKLDFRNSTFRKVESANDMLRGVDSLQELWLPLTFDLLEELKINGTSKWGETEEGLKSLKWTFGEGADDRVARGLKPCVITLDRKVYDRLSDEERAAAAKKGWTIAKY